MGKTLVLVMAFVVLGGAVLANAQEEKLTITTYYPSPYGVYKTLRLYPGPRETACQPGEMTYHDGSGGIEAGPYYCDSNGVWQPFGKAKIAQPYLTNSATFCNTGTSWVPIPGADSNYFCALTGVDDDTCWRPSTCFVPLGNAWKCSVQWFPAENTWKYQAYFDCDKVGCQYHCFRLR